jgi:two-component system cell cycle response regulator
VEVTRLALEARGYHVRTASNGDGAVQALQQETVDLVILDIMMDGVLDGWDASRRIRADGDARDVPILVVSSITSSEYLGMMPTDDDNLIDNFLSKPVDPALLLKEVGRLLRR